MANRKIEALQEAAAKKAKESAERVEKALERMIKQGQIISFKSVAQSANVSTAYLYKQEDLRNRIETLRNQQKQKPKSKQPPVASDNSKSVIISTLREENKKLRAEIEGLRRVNEGLAGRVYHLQASDDLVQRLKTDNASLKAKIIELEQELEQYHNQSQSSSPVLDNPKITSIEKKRTDRSDIADSIKQELINVGIQLNPTLVKSIKLASEEVVVNAIAAFKEAIVHGEIEKPGAWLKRAIEEEWTPNTPIGQTSDSVNSEFSQWFDLAKAQGIVRARQETEQGFMLQDNTDQWVAWESLIERGWTLEYLKNRAKPR